MEIRGLTVSVVLALLIGVLQNTTNAFNSGENRESSGEGSGYESTKGPTISTTKDGTITTNTLATDDDTTNSYVSTTTSATIAAPTTDTKEYISTTKDGTITTNNIATADVTSNSYVSTTTSATIAAPTTDTREYIRTTKDGTITTNNIATADVTTNSYVSTTTSATIVAPTTGTREYMSTTKDVTITTNNIATANVTTNSYVSTTTSATIVAPTTVTMEYTTALPLRKDDSTVSTNTPSTTAQPCENDGNCGITVPPSTTPVLNIDFDNDNDILVTEEKDESIAYEKYEKFRNEIKQQQETLNLKQQNYYNSIIEKIDSTCSTSKELGGIEAVNRRLLELENTMSKLIQIAQSFIATPADKTRSRNPAEESSGSLFMQSGNETSTEEEKSPDIKKESLKTEVEGLSEEGSTILNASKSSKSEKQEPTMEENPGRNIIVCQALEKKWRETNVERMNDFEQFRQDLLNKIKSTISETTIGRRLENLKYIVEDGGRTTTHEMITDNPSPLNPDPEIINTAETGGNDTNLHQGIQYPKVMMCNSCCEEVPLSVFLAQNKGFDNTEQERSYGSTEKAVSYDAPSATIYNRISKKNMQTYEDKFDIDVTEDNVERENQPESKEATFKGFATQSNSTDTTTDSVTTTTIPITSIDSNSVTIFTANSSNITNTSTAITPPPPTAPAPSQGDIETAITQTYSQDKLNENLPMISSTASPATRQTPFIMNPVIIGHVQKVKDKSEDSEERKPNSRTLITAIRTTMNASSLLTFISNIYGRIRQKNISTNYSTVKKFIESNISTETINATETSIANTYNQTIQANSTTLLFDKPSTPKPTKSRFSQSCAELYSAGHRRSGIYKISPLGRGSWKVYCDMETDGGGWTVIQRRMNGEVNFTKSWQDYVRGFGHINGDYWLGLERMHVLTTNARLKQRMVLRIDLKDWTNTSKYASYNTFRVGNAVKKYKLVVKQYSGTAGNALEYGESYNHNHQRFTTHDEDNDGYVQGNCGSYYQSGWWFNACFAANLNGRYYQGNYYGIQNGIYWGTWHRLTDMKDNSRFSFQYVDMKVRPVNFAKSTRKR